MLSQWMTGTHEPIYDEVCVSVLECPDEHIKLVSKEARTTCANPSSQPYMAPSACSSFPGTILKQFIEVHLIVARMRIGLILGWRQPAKC